MDRLPTGIGDPAAQARFLKENEAFLREYLELHRLLERTFIRQLAVPSQQDLEALEGLPDSDWRVIEFENKVWADRVVFYLGRVAVDDFGELLTLSGNGRGIGAYKILRGMYERIVTAAYIAKDPSEVRPFIEDLVIKKWKLWQSAVEVMPEIKDRFTTEQISDLKEQYDTAQAKRSISHCRKCGHPKTAEAWTRVDLASMAKKADPSLAALYGACYLEPTFHSHATVFGLERRLRPIGLGGYTYREISEEEARLAVLLGHNLILQLLTLQDEYFGLGLAAGIQVRIDMFLRIWGKAPTITNG